MQEVKKESVERLLALNPLDVFLLKETGSLFFVYDKHLDADLVRRKLGIILNEMPELGGRVVRKNNRYYIAVGRCEIELEVSSINEKIPDYGLDNALVDEKICVKGIDPELVVSGDSPLFSAKISNFSCGASVLGICISHCLADGGGLFELIARWAGLCRGDEKFIRMDSNRDELVGEVGILEEKSDYFINFDEAGFEKFNEEFRRSAVDKRYKVYLIKKERMDELMIERDAYLESGGLRFSVHDLLIAKLWKRVVSAQSDLSVCDLCSVFNFRGKDGLKVGVNYFPNAITIGKISYDSAVFKSMSAVGLAGKIRKMLVEETAAEKIKKEVFLMGEIQKNNPGHHVIYRSIYQAIMGGGVIINNFCRFPLSRIDFGGGKPYWFGNFNSYAPRHICIYPSFDRVGDLVVHVNLPGGEMEYFDKYVGDDLFN